MNANTVGWDFVGKYCVSTVRLSIDHGFGGEPLWFETMVFPAEDGKVSDWGELYCERYATQDEAIAGHARVFQMAETGALIDGRDDEEEIPDMDPDNLPSGKAFGFDQASESSRPSSATGHGRGGWASSCG